MALFLSVLWIRQYLYLSLTCLVSLWRATTTMTMLMIQVVSNQVLLFAVSLTLMCRSYSSRRLYQRL
ncbi:hypothetical protein BDB00DRAFT_857179 [Zychaea mexicana]|uniref:uncharacterized protein n=1 Tax=Zychaea mexicana TaxID=64656 RepID=UPI0022FE16FC|nr:uncharacterized protein BDB00DRAFT_857179 [Zychaea mexicana]KAI9482577.1 hypothetical protein BDB00DRAFT_857179 [Zychaea mexicana]